jgi:ketosteroid isomerase-like protein
MGASTIPGFSITWTTGQVWVSGSGDLAYESATNAVTAAAPGGKLVTESNKGIVVWKKQPDGSWKCAADIWNAEAPATTK